jgi:hypothetical protein
MLMSVTDQRRDGAASDDRRAMAFARRRVFDLIGSVGHFPPGGWQRRCGAIDLAAGLAAQGRVRPDAAGRVSEPSLLSLRNA